MLVSSEEISLIHLRVGYSINFFNLYRRCYSCDCSPEWEKRECCAAYAKHICELLKKICNKAQDFYCDFYISFFM